MADILVFIRTTTVTEDSGHWLDAPGELERQNFRIDSDSTLSTEQKIHSKEILAKRYSQRPRPGDIISIRPDGYFCEPHETTGHGWDHHCFALIKCPAIGNGKVYQIKSDTVKYRLTVATLGLHSGEIRTISTLSAFLNAVVDKNG